MVARPTLDIELRPLLRALKSRISDLGKIQRSKSDGYEVYALQGVPFLQLELRKDHMFLDLWLPPDKLEEAKASGIAKAHPFQVDEAVRVRFERAEDLTKVSRWLECSHQHAAARSQEGAA